VPNVVCASSESDIFADRPLQTSIVNTVEIGHKSTTVIDKRDLEFTVTKVDEDISIPICSYTFGGNCFGAEGFELYIKEYTAGVNNVTFSIRAMQHKSKRYFETHSQIIISIALYSRHY
jgi:hypothetical protein